MPKLRPVWTELFADLYRCPPNITKTSRNGAPVRPRPPPQSPKLRPSEPLILRPRRGVPAARQRSSALDATVAREQSRGAGHRACVPFGRRQIPRKYSRGAKYATKPPFRLSTCTVVNIWAMYGIISIDRTDSWTLRSNITPPTGDILRHCQKRPKVRHLAVAWA